MSVTIGSISAALLGELEPLSAAAGQQSWVCDAQAAGVSGHAHKNWGSDYAARAIFVRVLALIMMALSILMTLYAAYNFRIRGEMLLCGSKCRACCRSHLWGADL